MGYLVVTAGGIASVVANVFAIFAISRALHSAWLRSMFDSFGLPQFDSLSIYVFASALTIACLYSARRLPYFIASRMEHR